MATSDITSVQLPLPIEDATFEIPLTRGCVALVDAVDADLSEVNWRAGGKVGYFYAQRRQNKSTSVISMHRIILARKLDKELQSNEFADHINGNTLDNRRENLRVATHQQNMQNRKRAKHCSSGFKGVQKKKNRWRARIHANGKMIGLGYYSTPEEAYEAYCKAAEELHGEFANFGDR